MSQPIAYGKQTKSHEDLTTKDLDLEPLPIEDLKYHVEDYGFTPQESRAVTRKLDWRILPVAWTMYLFQALDRGNLGNAKTDGLEADLGFKTGQYGIMLSVFYIPFCLGSVPGMMLTRRFGPNITLPAMMFLWGAMCLANAGAKNFAQVTVIRLFLGLFESAFAPSLIYYLGTFYSRSELGKRVAAFYCCLGISGAFSGLISYGVFQVKSTTLHGWQLLFLVEGGATVIFAVLAYFLLPKSPSTCSWLTEREREIAILRLLKDGSAAVNTKFNAKAFFKPLKEPKTIAFATIALCYGTAGSVAGNFLPTIVAKFGYSVVKTNLYTVAPNMFGTVMLLATTYSSDRFRERSGHLMSALALVFIGCVILIAAPQSNIPLGYFAVFLIAGGAFTPSVIFHVWHQNNDPTEDGRAFKVAAFSFFANAGGFISSNIFFASEKPRYPTALGVTAGFEGLGLIVVLGLRTWMILDNKRRNRAQGVNWQSKDVPTEALAEGPESASFRHFY